MPNKVLISLAKMAPIFLEFDFRAARLASKARRKRAMAFNSAEISLKLV
jgi:hypothetical protein